jgi:hypothetical protein
MSVAWTIIDANGVEQSVADWGLGALTRERVNQAPDVVTFRAESTPSDAAPIFAYGSMITLRQNGTPWFYGRVVEVPGRAAAKMDEQLYRVAGPWWFLENLVFQQIWQITNGTATALIPTNKSRIILGQKSDGTKLATGAAIQEVLAYATARGVPITVGAVTPNAIAPYAETLDQSCAQVIRNFLRWTPDAMTAFDYTTQPPTLSIFRRADATTLSLPAYGAPISGLELTPRYDLQAPAVVLKYEQTNDIGNDTFTSLIIDAAPTTATGDEFGALVMTFDLAGARATYQTQPVVTTPIPQTDSDPGVIAWWKTKFAWLADFDDGDLQVESGTQSVTISDPANYPDLTTSDVPNELLSGSIATWMGLNRAPLLVSATMQFTGTPTDESNEVFGADNTKVLYARVTGTNAETETYSRLTSETEAEPVPAGLAQALYAAVSVLQYDGTIELTEQECSGWGGPGVLLNLTGGRAEWASMQAQIQRVVENIDLGQTKIVVGPARHLNQGELTAWLRANTTRRISFRLKERTTGSASGNAAQVHGGELSPLSDSVFRPSAGGTPEPNKPFQLLDASDTSGLKVTVNANSFLLQSLNANDTFAITGLATPIEVASGVLIWVEIDLNPDFSISAAAIDSDADGWTGYPNPFVYTGDPPDQVLTTVYLLVGYLADATSTLDGTVISGGPADAPVKAKIIQCVSQDVLMQNVVFNGMPAVFPFPHHAPGQ